MILLAVALLSGQRGTPPVDPTRLAAGSASTGPALVAMSPALVATPSPSTPQQSPAPIARGAFAGDLLIADRGNGRILIVDAQGQILLALSGSRQPAGRPVVQRR